MILFGILSFNLRYCFSLARIVFCNSIAHFADSKVMKNEAL
jgi:hypothetical protein